MISIEWDRNSDRVRIDLGNGNINIYTHKVLLSSGVHLVAKYTFDELPKKVRARIERSLDKAIDIIYDYPGSPE
jgi:hypothetical protein